MKLWWLLFFLPLGSRAMRAQNVSCPDALESLESCACEVWLSGIKLACVEADWERVKTTLVEADLPLSTLRLARTRGFPSAVPREAFGPLLIKELDLANNEISSLALGALAAQSDSLRLLRLANNSLAVIPPLRSLSRLESLDLTGNQLGAVPEISLPPNLHQLRLRRNDICSLSPVFMGPSKTSLVLLDLAENCLRSVPSVALRGAPQLAFLDLSSNAIAGELAFHAFADMPKLKELRLADNPLRGLGNRAFSNLPALEHFSVRGAALRSLPRGVIQAETFPALRILDLSGNEIARLESGALSGLPRLRQLLLDGNGMKALQTRAIADNPALQLLSLQNNVLDSLEAGALENLPSLLILLLSNNSLGSLEQGTLGGLSGLQQLSLRRAGLSSVSPRAFLGLESLATIDAAHNSIDYVAPGTLEPLKALAWLDLTENRISSFPNGSLPRQIPNLLLSGNPLDCSREPVTYLLAYLSKYNVRTSLPDKPKLVCATPSQYKGIDMKELLRRRANETFFTGVNNLVPGGFRPGGGGSSQLPLANLLPSLEQIPGIEPVGIPGLNAPIPGLNTIARAVPGLAELPGLNAIVNPNIASPGEPEELIDSFQDFTQPLSRFVVGEKPTANDVTQMISSLPKIANQIPSFANIDVSKASPEVIRAFIEGSEIPGIPIPSAAREQITRRVLSQMARAAAAANRGAASLDGRPLSELLPAPSNLPPSIIRSVLQGQPLGRLSLTETAQIRDYYAARLLRDPPPIAGEDKEPSQSDSAQRPKPQPTPDSTRPMAEKPKNAGKLPVDELISVIGQDISMVPDSIITAIARGETLNPADLPESLIKLVRERDPSLADRVESIVLAAKTGLERVVDETEAVEKIQATQALTPAPSTTSTTSTEAPRRPVEAFETEIIDIDDVRVELIEPGSKSMDDRLVLYSLAGVGAVLGLTLVTIAVLCWRRRYAGVHETPETGLFLNQASEQSSMAPSTSPMSLDEVMEGYGSINRRPMGLAPVMSPSSPFYTGWSRPLHQASFDDEDPHPRHSLPPNSHHSPYPSPDPALHSRPNHRRSFNFHLHP